MQDVASGFAMSNYQDFLKRKIKVAENYGFVVNPEDINAVLFPHQKDIVTWALHGGRRAVFASFGLGKTIMQLEIGYHLYQKTKKPILFGLPLAVRGEFAKDAKLLQSGRTKKDYIVTYCRNNDEVKAAVSLGAQFIMANYERIRTGSFEMDQFGGVCLDEASVIRSMGSQTTQYILHNLKKIEYRFVFTATPSPNEYHELLKYSEFLGIMDIGNALSRFFKRDSVKAHNSSLLEHREADFWLWLSTWATFITKPSDLGYDDTGYDFPEFKVIWHRITVKDRATMMKEKKIIVKGEFKKVTNALLIPDQAKGIKETSAEKRTSLFERVELAYDIISKTDDNWIIWHHREDERAEIQKVFGKDCKPVYGSQDEETREDYLIGFSEGQYKYLSTKPRIAGSGCNFQYFCHKAVFVGIDYKFNDFIQAVHRVYRFGQNHPVEIHIVYTDLEEDIKYALERKWSNHNKQVAMMTKIIKENKLSTNIVHDQKRKFGLERIEHNGKNFKYVNNDSCIELPTMCDNSIDMICSSIPFSDLFEYADSYSDMGQSLGDKEFFEHMDFLTPHLHRVLQPGRLAAIHVKDVIKYRWQNDAGFPIVHRFSDRTCDHFEKHGFYFFGRITVTTDVVKENSQTYRLGHSEKCKDGTKMGVGLPEYILLFRKAPTDKSNGYADLPVKHKKLDFTRAKWQLDAHSYWKNNGNRLLTDAEIQRLNIGDIMAWWTCYDLENPYNYDVHVELSTKLDKFGKLPTDFMVLPPKSNNNYVWDDIQRIDTLNTSQAQQRMVKHVCLAADTLVLTQKGYVKIQDVQLGDLTLTHNGNWKPIIAKELTQKDAKVIQTKAQGVPKLVTTPEHNLWCRKLLKLKPKKSLHNPEWVEAKDTKGHYLNQKLPKVLDSPLTNDECWIIGRWLADGHLDHRQHQFFVSIGQSKLDHFISMAGKYIGANRQKVSCIQIGLINLSDNVRDMLFKCKHGAENKVLPIELISLDKDKSTHLLNGYLSGDGHLTKSGTTTASSVSRALLLGFSIVIQRALNVIPSIYAGKKARKYIIEGRTVNTKQDWVLCYKQFGKHSFGQILDDGAWKKVAKIEDANNADVWCLQVKDDESFTAEGCIVKNCPLQLSLIDRLIELFSNPGETVLDPFGGIGSVGYQGLKMKSGMRKSIMIELNNQYFLDGIRHCKAQEYKAMTPTLFDSLESI